MDTSLVLNYVIVISSVLLIVSVLLQSKNEGGSMAFSGASENYYTRRGFEKVLFATSVVMAVILVGAVLGKGAIG